MNILIIAFIIFLVAVLSVFLIPNLRKIFITSFKEGHKKGEEWGKNSSLGNIAYDLGKKIGETGKKLKE